MTNSNGASGPTTNFWGDSGGSSNTGNGGGGIDPMKAMMALLGGGSDILGSIMSAFSANKQLQQQNDQFQQTAGASQAQSQAQMMSQFLTNGMSQANMGLAATQMNPYQQVEDRNSANVKRSFAEGYDSSKGFSGTFDTSALNPSNLDKGATDFYKAMATAAPNTPTGNAPADAYRTGPGGPQATQDDQKNQIMTYLGGQTGSKNDPQAAIKGVYQEVTGGKYQPSAQELTQFGTDIDANYLNKIRASIAQWWAQKNGQQ